MWQPNRETKRNQRNKKGKVLLLFNKIGKGCILDKNRKVLVNKKLSRLVSNKGSFIAEEHFLYIW